LIDDAVDGILVIEWADAIEGVLPPDHLRVEFVIADDDSRVVTLDGSPARWQEMSTELHA
jgi:tRNA A37 threonylcarbamoyladenosine biosynthesis protein TsaE